MAEESKGNLDNVNVGKSLGHHTEKLEVCNLSPAAFHLTAPFLFNSLPQTV